MILTRDIINSVLYGLKEHPQRTHSEPEMINALNVVLRYINVALINAKSSWIIKEYVLKPRNGVAVLPDDFGGFVQFENAPDKYKFLGNKVKIDENSTMYYTYVLPQIESIDDEIDLPYVLFDVFSRFTLGILNEQFANDMLSNLIGTEVNKLMSDETLGPIERPYPFYV